MFGFTARGARQRDGYDFIVDRSRRSSRTRRRRWTPRRRSGPTRRSARPGRVPLQGRPRLRALRRPACGSASAIVGRIASYRDISAAVRIADALEQHRTFLETGAGSRAHRQLGGRARRLRSPRLVGRIAPHLRRPARSSSRDVGGVLRRSCIRTIAPRCARRARRRPPAGSRTTSSTASCGRTARCAGCTKRPSILRDAQGRRAADGRHRAGHHRAAAARGSAPAVAEDGSDRPAGRRHRARSQQRADGDRRLRRARARRSGVGSCGARRRRGDPARRRARRIGDAPAAGVQPQAAARAARVRSQRDDRRDLAGCCRGCSARTSRCRPSCRAGRCRCSAIRDRSSRR